MKTVENEPIIQAKTLKWVKCFSVSMKRSITDDLENSIFNLKEMRDIKNKAHKQYLESQGNVSYLRIIMI